MAGITDPESWMRGEAVPVLCEGCGPIQVDPAGNCVSPNCLHRGKPGHGLPWVGEPGWPGTPMEEPGPEPDPPAAAPDLDDIEF